MDLALLLGAVAVVAAVGFLWWGVTARPSAARGNLYTGLDDSSSEPAHLVSFTRRLGARVRGLLPDPLVDGLEVSLVQAGHPRGIDLPRLLGIKTTLAAVSALLLVLYGQWFAAVIVSPILFFLPDYWVLSERDRRQARIRADAADVIDQLTICVEAGLGFDAALARVVATTEGALTEELDHTLSDIRAGVPRGQALRALADRAQIPEIRQLVSALMQAQKHGVSMAETLRIQSAEMRTKRTQLTEERAAKLPVKLVFPIVMCFLPVFVIITVVPALLSIAEAL